jgi:hypothetical protein
VNGGERHDRQSNNHITDHIRKTLTQEHYVLFTTPRDMGPTPSLDLSLYPLLQAPGHIEHFPELDVGPLAVPEPV